MFYWILAKYNICLSSLSGILTALLEVVGHWIQVIWTLIVSQRQFATHIRSDQSYLGVKICRMKSFCQSLVKSGGRILTRQSLLLFPARYLVSVMSVEVKSSAKSNHFFLNVFGYALLTKLAALFALVNMIMNLGPKLIS